MRFVLEISPMELSALIDFFKYGAEHWVSVADVEPNSAEVVELFKYLDKEKYSEVVTFLDQVLKARFDLLPEEERERLNKLPLKEVTRMFATQSVELLSEMNMMITSQLEKMYEKNPELKNKRLAN